MRKVSLMKKIVSAATALTLVLVMSPAMSAQAASEYTVTFRPGNVGQFGIASETDSAEKTVKEMAQEVADIYYAQYETTVTENGAIKVKVPAGADVPAAPGYIIPNEGYCVRSWGPEQGTKVTKNVDYVVDYGRLIDGVEYTVKYVDEESGESIAPFLTAYANIGDNVTVSAPTSIVTSDAGEYVLVSDTSQKITVGEDADANVVIFSYVYSYDPGTVEQDVIVTIPGDTVVTTETVTTYIDNGTTVEPGAVVVEDENQDADNDNEADAEVDAEQEVEDEDEQGGENQDMVEIEDEETPLANIPETDASEEVSDMVVEIEDEEAPLSSGVNSDQGMSPMVIVAAVFGIAAIALAFVWMKNAKKRNSTEEQ